MQSKAQGTALRCRPSDSSGNILPSLSSISNNYRAFLGIMRFFAYYVWFYAIFCVLLFDNCLRSINLLEQLPIEIILNLFFALPYLIPNCLGAMLSPQISVKKKFPSLISNLKWFHKL